MQNKSKDSSYNPKTHKRYWIGVWFSISGAILFSAKAIVAKLTYQHGVDALTVMGLRMILAAPFFALIALYQMYKVKVGKQAAITKKQILQLIALGFCGYYLASYLDFMGLQYISAGLERLILFLAPTVVLLISTVYLKRTILKKQWIALCLSYVGVVLVFVQDLSVSGDNVILGSTFVLGSVISYSIYLIGSGELLKKIGATRLVAYAMLISTVISTFHFLIKYSWHGLYQSAAVYKLSFIHSTLNTVIPTLLMMWSVAIVGAPMAAQLGLIGPVSVLFLAAWFLDEPITMLQLVGTAITLIGAMVLSKK